MRCFRQWPVLKGLPVPAFQGLKIPHRELRDGDPGKSTENERKNDLSSRFGVVIDPDALYDSHEN
jgi:hypothetical protein